MKSLMLIIDGLGDDPIVEWNWRTPYEYARHINMDSLSNKGLFTSISICEDDIVAESSTCILRLLGVDKKDMPTNRAYLELLANGMDISEYEMVMRCNLVAVNSYGKLVGFNGMGLSNSEMKEAAMLCSDIFQDIEFVHLSEYRNLIVMDRRDAVFAAKVKPPHESIGEDAEELLAELKSNSLSIKLFLEQAEEKLKKYSRCGLTYKLYPWGVAKRETLPSFYNLHKIRGGVVCKAEIVKGIAKALGMDIAVPRKATGDIDTDIKAKALASVEMLESNDFVLAHFNGTDEAAHRYNHREKAEFIEKIDSEFLELVLAKVREPLKIIICGDHVTSSVTGKHARGKGPVIAANLGTDKKIELKNYQDIIKFIMKECDGHG